MEPLPIELLDCVIENLYSDTPSLLSCALVGRAWVRSSQRGIFRHIALRSPSPLHVSTSSMDVYLDKTRKLIALFESSPRLASYVRFLELENFFNINGNLNELHAATANVIQPLSNLNHVELTHMSWTVLSPTLKAALAKVIRRSSSLREFTISSFFRTSLAELTLLLNKMPRQLKSLHLASIYLDQGTDKEEMEQDDLSSKSTQLENLTLSDCDAETFMDWFRKDTCPFEVRNLQSLHMSEYEGRDMDNYLHYVGRNLRELSLNISSVCSKCLTYMPNLRILHLRSIALTSSSSPVPMICTIFEPLFHRDGYKSSLQRLKIDLIINDISQQVAQLDQWAEIDGLFNRPEFSLLERVDVNLLNQGCLNLTSTENLLRGKLQILEASGKLYMYHHIWRY